MKKNIQTALFLIIAILFQVSCDNAPFAKKKKTKYGGLENIIAPQIPKWLSCQAPGNIDIGVGDFNYFCLLPPPVESGFIFNYDTKEKILTPDISFDSGIKLNCGCKWDGSGTWYKSPTPNPVNGQKVIKILDDNDQPLTTYQRGDILYCDPSDLDNCTGNASSKFQKLTIK